MANLNVSLKYQGQGLHLGILASRPNYAGVAALAKGKLAEAGCLFVGVMAVAW